MRLSPLVLAPLLAACASAQPPLKAKAPGRYVETFTFGGKPRRFILRVPKGYDGSRKVPVVMVLHGWTGSAAAAEQYTRLAALGEKEGFVTVFPDGLGPEGFQGWNAGFINLTGIEKLDDVGFLGAVLDRVEKEIEVDRDREFVAGHSNGAFMANDLASQLGSRIAAIASMAGSVGLPGKMIPTPMAAVSVLLLHGKGDTMVGYAPTSKAMLTNVGAVASARFWAKADGCSLTPQTTRNGKVTVDRYLGGRNGTEVQLVTTEDGGHDWWGGLGRGGDVPTYGAPAADLAWEFFKAHPKRRG